jgi:hypothetical protein
MHEASLLELWAPKTGVRHPACGRVPVHLEKMKKFITRGKLEAAGRPTIEVPAYLRTYSDIQKPATSLAQWPHQLETDSLI